MIATSTPEKVRIQDNEMKRNNKSTKPSKSKQKLEFTAPVAERSDSEEDSDSIPYDNDSSNYESEDGLDRANRIYETDIEELKPEDFVIVKFETKKTKLVYVEKILNKSKDSETTDTVFLNQVSLQRETQCFLFCLSTG